MFVRFISDFRTVPIDEDTNIVVVGCSTSEVVGAKIGTNSNPDAAGEIFSALYDYSKDKGIFLAIQ